MSERADFLVNNRSPRYLHGFQRNVNETTELPHNVPTDNQVTYIDSFTSYGISEVYGDQYVISSSEGNDPRIQDALNQAEYNLITTKKYHGIYWNNDNSTYETTISYNVSTRTFTITPTSGSFRIYLDGVIHVFYGPQSITHAATEGAWFFYYDETGTLLATQTPWSLLTDVPLAFLYYDATTPDFLLLEERHHHESDKEWHNSQHYAMGTFVKNGTDFVLGNYTIGVSSDAAVTWSLGSGTVVDEDINTAVAAVADGGPYQTWYKSGASGAWRRIQRSIPYHFNGTTNWIQYNQLTGGAWQLTDLGNNQFTNYYIFGVPATESSKQIIVIPSQQVYATETLADNEGLSDLDLTGFPSQEFVGLWKLVMRADTGGGATGKAQIRKVTRLVGARTASFAGGTAPTVHNSLSGRADADTHPASSITNTPAGNIAATTVQAAINELDSEKGGLALNNSWSGTNAFSANCGFGTTSPQRQIHTATSNAGTVTLLAAENSNVTNNNGIVVSFRTSTSGTGASSFVELSGIEAIFQEHNHATRKGCVNIFTSNSGSFRTFQFTCDGELIVPGTTASTSTTTGAIVTSGGIGVSGAIYAGGASRFTSATSSSSTSTGAVVVTGGVGIGGALYVGGTINGVGSGITGSAPGLDTGSSGYSRSASCVADGITRVFLWDGSPVYRTDWQGRSLLYTSSRTNLCTYSQEMDNANWLKDATGTGVAPIVTPNYAAAPDGTTTAERAQFNRGAGTTFNDTSRLQSAFVTLAGTYTCSIWLKTNDGSSRSVRLSVAGTGATTVTVTPTWQRFSFQVTMTGAFRFRIEMVGNIGPDATGDISVWGAQIETGSVVTSYIATTTGSASVTDYSASGSIVTLASAPLAGALLHGLDSAPTILPGTYTVASLPTAIAASHRAYVTDANATTFASIVAGGGTNGVPVYHDGTNWRIG